MPRKRKPKPGRPRTYSDHELLRSLRRFKRDFKRTPRMSDLGKNRPDGYPSAGTLVYRFGSFTAALKAAGLQENS